MTTTPIVKLVHGSKSINLISTGEYWPIDFTPPTTQETPTTARGTVQNRYSGSELVSTTANDTAFSFVIDCYGTTEGEAKGRARKLSSFIKSHMGDRVTPLQLHYRGNSDVAAEPLWGEYGANSRFTIIYATISGIDPYYMVSDLRSHFVRLTIDALLQPFSEGLKMRLGTATGGILEDILSTVDGRSRGLIIPEATTNKMTNPIFGHATYDNGWTTQADIISTENTDEEFVMFGSSSVRLVATGTTNRSFYQSINVGNTNTHILTCYAKKQDGSAVSSSDLVLRYGATLGTDSYTSVGNGRYRLQKSVTGIASAQVTGVAMAATVGAAIYVDGFQIEEKSYATPLCHGDMLGCAWTGTAHASTSTRTAASYHHAFTDVLNTTMGTIRVVWKAARANTTYSGAQGEFFRTDTVNFIGRFNGADNKFYFLDGTNTISSAATTFSAGDTIVLHFVFKQGSLKIYRAGVEIATGSTYTPPAGMTNIYWGSSDSSTLHAGGTFMEIATYDYAMSATEALNDYTNIAAVIADGERVGCIPWRHASGGSANYDNYEVCGGIPGTIEAKTEYVVSNALGDTSDVWMALLDYDTFINPSKFNIEGPGTAVSIGTSTTELESGTIESVVYEALKDRDCYLFTYAKAASSISATLQMAIDNFVGLANDERTEAISQYYSYHRTNGLIFPANNISEVIESNSITLSLDATVPAGATNVYCDFFQVVPAPLIYWRTRGTSWLDGGEVLTRGASTAVLTVVGYTGKHLELYPHKINTIFQYVNNISTLIGGADTPVVVTSVIDTIDITPRYALL